MAGLLASKGLKVGERRVGEPLSRVNPAYNYLRRTVTARQLNPVHYKADYFGHKMHVNQNKKLVMYGVTHACAVDGFTFAHYADLFCNKVFTFKNITYE